MLKNEYLADGIWASFLNKAEAGLIKKFIPKT